MRKTTPYVQFALGLLVLLAPAWAMARDKMPIPPADARWTLFCKTFEGPARVEESKLAREALVKQTGDNNWYLIHGENESTLTFGFYRNVELEGTEGKDKKDAERAREDRKRIMAMQDAGGRTLFRTCFFVPADAPGDDGPAEWNILNAPKEAFWTLLIGKYIDNPDRKKAAVDAVRLLRQQGVEAFYYHTARMSVVYVGQWPEASILYEEPDTSHIPEGEGVMLIERPIDPRAPRTQIDENGQVVHIVAPTLTIQDPTVNEMMKKFPNFHTNGEVLGKRVKDPLTKKEHIELETSVLARVPRREKSLLSSGDRPTAPPELKMIKPPGGNPPPKGSGALKSLKEN